MNNGLEGKYVIKDNKKLALGYTTGSCATGASKAAAIMLLTGEKIEYVSFMTPKGIELHLQVHDSIINLEEGYASCAVKKDGGDDPDATHGTLVYSKVSMSKCDSKLREVRVHIDGGKGVGRVTKPGLDQPVGNAAINSTPRRMITENIIEVCEKAEFCGDVYVEISIPEGEEIAVKTFNPRLGIVGGISVLGTSGIVEPMSEDALIASIKIELNQKIQQGAQYLLITPGNYGTTYLKTALPMESAKAIKCSNYIGQTIDMAVELGAKGVLFVGHLGKFVKLAGGIMNTHSKNADSRMEILAANAMLSDAKYETLKKLMECVTTDDAVKVLKEESEELLEATLEKVTDKMLFYLNNRAHGALKLGVITFSNVYGELGKAGEVDELIQLIHDNMTSR